MSKRNWKRISSEKVFSTPYFSVSRNSFSDSLEYKDDFYRFNFTDWVNVVPETDTGDFIMIKIFRFGIEDYSLEFPGGQVEKGSSPDAAATCELLEETGYTADTIQTLGWVHPNPANQDNKCFFYHARGLLKSSDQRLEDAEDISLCVVPKNELPNLIAGGKVTHSLSLLAYFYLCTRAREAGEEKK